MKPLISLLAVICIALSGCSGGGGCVHNAPENIKAGTPIDLYLELSAWGAGSGKLNSRYTKITCHYRDVSKSAFQSVEAKILSADETRMRTVMTIPPETVTGAEEIEYYFDFLFDGVYNRRSGVLLKLQK
jgi:hypothetical protein